MKQVPLCIYHGACDDGFAAAWVVRRALGDGNVEFYPGVYQQEPPDVTGRDVIFVDFSYKRAVLDKMADKAHSMLILDHHKTAQEDLADVPGAPPWQRWQVWDDPLLDAGVGPWRRGALFDMERSGAALAWDYFVGGQRPEFIEYIQDRDLWRKALPAGDEFTIALRSWPQNFKIWDDLFCLGGVTGGEITGGTEDLIQDGRAIQRYYRLRVEELKRSAYSSIIAGHPVLIANAPYFAASEVAGELAEMAGQYVCDGPEGLGLGGFGACYFEVAEGRWQYSLRSRGDVDVSAVARKFGGGGHKAAAGFTADRLVHKP